MFFFIIVFSHVTNLSTKKEKESQNARIFGKIQNQKWQESAFAKKKKGARQNFRLVFWGFFMLSKKNRVDKKAVEKVFKEGKVLNSSFLTFKFILKDTPLVPRISFIVPKNVAKLAVRRNLLRRLGYTALREHLGGLPALLGVFIFKKYQNNISILENEIKDIFNRIN